MKYFNALIKPASSRCNLRCKYCFYYDVADHRQIQDYGIMTDKTMKSIIDKVLDYFKEETRISFSFQGGEPTVAGLDYFAGFVSYVRERKKNITLSVMLFRLMVIFWMIDGPVFLKSMIFWSVFPWMALKSIMTESEQIRINSLLLTESLRLLNF